MGSRVSLPKGSWTLSTADGGSSAAAGASVRLAVSAVVVASVSLVSLSLTLLGAGCSRDASTVSSKLFLAPQSAEIRLLANKIRFLQAIEPTKLPSELASIPTDTFVLGHLSTRNDIDGAVTQSPNLVVYENQSRSVESVNSCPEGTNQVDCGSVKLNYNAQGLDDTQSSQGAITSGSVLSSSVTPLQLASGWILAYDSGSRNIVAFREEAPRTLPNGDPIGFRTFASAEGKANKNFGFGNGLVLSLVISGEELARQIRATSEPIVTRFVEIEDDKVLLFFSTVRAVHLLELSEDSTPLAFDLNDVDNPDKRLPVPLLRGAVKLMPDPAGGPALPFLTFRAISEEITGNTDVKVDSFQPILVPTDGATLVFEQTTSQFIKVLATKAMVDDPENPGQQIEDIVGSTLERAVLGLKVLSVLQQGVGGNVVSPPLDFRNAFYHQTNTEICLFEEKTNNLLAYDYTKGLQNNLRIMVGAESFLQPRGSTGGVAGSEPVLTWAVKDVTDNRLGFDQGLDQLLSVSYKASEVVVVASRLAITGATLNTLAALNYVEPLTSTDVRAFDNQSNSLILMRLTYATLPVKVK